MKVMKVLILQKASEIIAPQVKLWPTHIMVFICNNWWLSIIMRYRNTNYIILNRNTISYYYRNSERYYPLSKMSV